MDFFRSYFFKNETSEYIIEHLLTIYFIKIRFSCNQNIGETLTQCKNVLIPGESNCDEKNGQLIKDLLLKK